MASRRKGKSNRPSLPGRSGSLDSPQDGFVQEIDIRGEYVQKDAYLALRRAFDGVTKNVLVLRNENKNLVKNIKLCESRLESSQNENEALKEKIALGFIAYDEKYKEHETLKKEFEAVKEEGSKHVEDRGQEQQDLVVQKEEIATQTKESLDSAREEHKTKDNYTQTSEEKTDEVGCIPPTTTMKLLKNCGLEIVSQNRNYYLFLSERDKLKKWLENETDGKVSVAFEKTPVYERFVQTDIKMIGKKTQCGECAECKAIIIELKKKIVDQANTIKRFREYQGNMPTDSLRGQRSGLKKVLSVEVQTVGKVYDELFMKKRFQSLEVYKNKVSKSMHLLQQKLVQLNKELEYQNKFSNRLLAIISNTMDVPENFVATVLSTVQGKSGKMKMKKAPVPRAYLEKSLAVSQIHSPPESFDSSGEPFLSLPVQETDRRLRVKISKPRDPDYDSANDEEVSSVAPGENRSLTSESSASIVPAEEGPQNTLLVDNNTNTSGTRDVLPTPSISGISASSTRVHQGSGHDDGDDIVVIDENEAGAVGEEGGAVGEEAGAKECPICYILYTPGTSQRDYEKHVMDHFQD